MRLTIEQIRAGAAAIALASGAGQYVLAPVGGIPWRFGMGLEDGTQFCCPGQAMWSQESGMPESTYLGHPMCRGMDVDDGKLFIRRSEIFSSMCELLGYGDREAGLKTTAADAGRLFTGILLAAELTEKRAAEARARAEEWNVRQEQKTIMAEEEVLV